MSRMTGTQNYWLVLHHNQTIVLATAAAAAAAALACTCV